MNDTGPWCIPPSVRRGLEEAPTDRPVVLLLRHSVRRGLPQGDADYGVPITEMGVQLACELGALMGSRLRSLYASPVPRCVQTAEALARGAEVRLSVVPDRLLGDPGVFVLDGRRAWANWESLGHEGVMKHLVASDQPLPGMARPDCAARFLVHHMLAAADGEPGVHVFVTHDSLVFPTAARILGQALGRDSWPWYLEGAFFWRESVGLRALYRGYDRCDLPPALCGFTEADVIEFARREIAATVGLDSGARFFLAGGAFKTLLTGRAPRDLDLWAPSPGDRTRLISALCERGARRLDDREFANAFAISGRVVEVPHETEPHTLCERLGCFDLALSAIGVEHGPGDLWAAEVHPHAHSGVERREVRLLRPIANPRQVLGTLGLLRRYAGELGFIVPPEDEAEVWRTFLAYPADERAAMLTRFMRTAHGGWNVAEDTARLSR